MRVRSLYVVALVPMFWKKTTSESIALPIYAPVPAGLGMMKTMMIKMTIKATTHRGMRSA